MSKKAVDQIEKQRLEDVIGGNVSRETLNALNIYRKTLIKWNSSINLVSTGTIKDVWGRHILDSAQLYPLLPKDSPVVFDFGSGAGFPGMVLAILAGSRGRVFLCESDQRKSLFLGSVSRETNTGARIINQRVESMDIESLPAPDVITARALAPLEKLLALSLPWFEANPDLVLLFLKGRDVKQEIKTAQKTFGFDADVLPSRTSCEGRLLKIKRLERKT